MSETAPDMRPNDADRERRERAAVADEEAAARSSMEGERAQAEIREQLERDHIASQEEAARVAAGLKKPKVEQPAPLPPSESKLKGLALGALGSTADATMGVGEKVGPKIMEGWDGFWTAIEKKGDAILKPYQDKMKIAPWALAALTPLVGGIALLFGAGTFVGNKLLLKPAEKSLAEQNAEWEKKWEAEQKKKKAEEKKKEAEDKRKKKLEKSGLTEEQAEALLEASKADEKEDEKNEDKPKEEKAA